MRALHANMGMNQRVFARYAAMVENHPMSHA